MDAATVGVLAVAVPITLCSFTIVLWAVVAIVTFDRRRR